MYSTFPNLRLGLTQLHDWWWLPFREAFARWSQKDRMRCIRCVRCFGDAIILYIFPNGWCTMWETTFPRNTHAGLGKDVEKGATRSGDELYVGYWRAHLWNVESRCNNAPQNEHFGGPNKPFIVRFRSTFQWVVAQSTPPKRIFLKSEQALSYDPLKSTSKKHNLLFRFQKSSLRMHKLATKTVLRRDLGECLFMSSYTRQLWVRDLWRLFNVAFYQAGLEFTRRLNMASLRLASFQRGWHAHSQFGYRMTGRTRSTCDVMRSL